MVNKGVNGIEDLIYPQSDELHYAEVQKAHENDEPLLDYEELKEHQFNEMMKVIEEDELVQNPHGPQDTDEVIMTPTDADVSPMWDPKVRAKLAKKPKAIFQKETRECRALECAMGTEDYLGYLAGASFIAMLSDRYVLAKFYRGLHDKFVKENTPR